MHHLGHAEHKTDQLQSKIKTGSKIYGWHKAYIVVFESYKNHTWIVTISNAVT